MAGRKRGLLLVWLVMFFLLAVPLYGQSILTQAVSGTGFIVSSDGYILTNKHVINGATKISVTIGSKEYEAKVVDSLSDNDIALLKIDTHGLPTVALGDSDKVQIGNTVYAIGCPAGVCGTITAGRIANLGITSKTDEGTTLHNLIMSDLTTTHGSSGGPLLNDKGEVIGITTAGIVVQGETTGFGVSIPINQAMPLLRQVPGFSTSQIGKATRTLSLDEIRRSVGPATVFVQAEMLRPLSDLLPRQALGESLEIATGTPIYYYDLVGLHRGPFSKDTALLWQYLQRKHIKMTEAGEAHTRTESQEAVQEITIDIFECASPAEASRALSYLKVPTSWHLKEPQPELPELSLPPLPLPLSPCAVVDGPEIFDVPLLTSLDAPLYTLLSTSQRSADVVVNSVIYYATYPNTKYSCLERHSGSCSPSDEPCTFRPCLGLWGYRSFAIGNLAFLIAYRNSIAGPELPAEGCAHVIWPWGGEDWNWTSFCYKWSRDGYVFVLSEEYVTRPYVVRIDITPVINNFDWLLKTVFGGLANQ